jgi:hypothetical protein
MRRRIITIAALVVVTSCTPAYVVPSSPVGSAPPSVPIIGTSSGTITSLSLPGAGASAAVTVSESGYTGSFTATSSNTAIVTLAAATAASVRRATAGGTAMSSTGFTLTGAGSGSANVTVADQNGRSTQLAVTVGNAVVTASPSTIALTSIGATQTVAVSETGYFGTFTAASSDTAVATVAAGTVAGSFTVTAVSAGTATITFTDTSGMTATVQVGVTATSGVIYTQRP